MPVEGPRQAEAYREYVRLGLRRNYERLHDRLREQWGDADAPTIETIKRWSQAFGWRRRVIEDDELINRRALDRIRDKMAHEGQRRRESRLQLSDIQLNAALQAMVEKKTDKDTGVESVVPRDLLDFDPATLRAINDTVRLASETQRLDSGEATQRLAQEEMTLTEQRGRAELTDDALAGLFRFVGISEDTGELSDMEAITPERELPPPGEEQAS